MKKKTLVIGASLKENRYSNKAIKKLTAVHIPVVAIGLLKGVVASISIDTEKVLYQNIHFTHNFFCQAQSQLQLWLALAGLS